MPIPTSPRVICISDPDFASKPYPYTFACVPNKVELLCSEVLHINPANATFESFKKDIGKFKPDLIFGFIQDLANQIKISSFLSAYHPVPALNWSLEDPNGIVSKKFDSTMLDVSENFDLWFCNDSKMVPFWKTKAFFMPPGFDDSVYFNSKIPKVFDVSYVGNLSFENEQMFWPHIKGFAAHGKKAAVCINRPMGLPLLPKAFERLLRSNKHRRFLQSLPFWQCHWENPKTEQEKALLINRSKIHWGMNRVKGGWEDSVKDLIPAYPLDKHNLFYQLKGRIFHAVGTGTMALNEYCPELENLFDIGKEIVTFEFGELEDLREKISWYISHDSEREKIALAGYKRGRRQHTFTERVRQVLDITRKNI